MAYVDDFVHELAARVAGTRATPLSPGTRDTLARRLFDLTGSIAAGLQTAEAQATLAVLRRMHATATGTATETPAYLLGALTVAARSTELDDIDLISCTTPGSVVIPAALVAGAIGGASSDTLAAAVVAGYDVMTALGLALDGANAVYGSRWPTYFGAAMSVAAAVSTALQLSEERTLTALAIAASMTTPYAGRIATDPISRWLTLAAAAQAGLASALAAAEGLHGDANIFSACLGVEDTHVANARRAFDRPALERTSAKPFCTGRQSLSAIEAFQHVIHDGVDPARIERIEVFVPEQYRAMIDRARHARTKSESRGVRYQIALAAYHPGDLFDIDRIRLRLDDPAMTRLIDCIDVLASGELTRLYPQKWAGTVRVTSAGGSRTETVVEPAGDPEHALSWSDVEHKLRAVAAHLPGGVPVDALAAAARTLNFSAALAELTPFAGRFPPPANARR
ncbi:MAG: MmgE/PrpD family protein [Candidatus Lustribacter sp.]